MGDKKGKRKSRVRETPGPKADVLKIDMDWKEAIKKSLKKQKPIDGWPKSA